MERFEHHIQNTFSNCTLIQCDLDINDEDYAKFSEMSPIFYRTSVPNEFVGDNGADENQVILVGGVSATKITINVQLLKVYLKIGVKIKHVHKIFELKGSRCFSAFVEDVVRNLSPVDKPSASTNEKLKDLWKQWVYMEACSSAGTSKSTLASQQVAGMLT